MLSKWNQTEGRGEKKGEITNFIGGVRLKVWRLHRVCVCVKERYFKKKLNTIPLVTNQKQPLDALLKIIRINSLVCTVYIHQSIYALVRSLLNYNTISSDVLRLSSPMESMKVRDCFFSFLLRCCCPVTHIHLHTHSLTLIHHLFYSLSLSPSLHLIAP